jgi:hypothetical protein
MKTTADGTSPDAKAVDKAGTSEDTKPNDKADPIKTFISTYKTPITTTLLTISFSACIFSILKRTRNTNDFGFGNLVKQPFLRGNVQHASWIWAFRAFTLSTSIVGLGMTGLVVSLSYYYNVSTVKEFSIEFRKSIMKRFPNLVPDQISEERENRAMTEFMKEIVGDLDQERQETEQEQMVTGTMKSVFGKI